MAEGQTILGPAMVIRRQKAAIWTLRHLSRVNMQNLHLGANLLPGANLHPLALRLYANKCVHMHLNLI